MYQEINLLVGPDLFFLVSVGSGGSGPQLVIGLFQQVFGLLSMTLHVPLIGLLGRHYFFEGLLAEPLRRGDVGMAAGGNVLFRQLGQRDTAEDEQGAQNRR